MSGRSDTRRRAEGAIGEITWQLGAGDNGLAIARKYRDPIP
jgi:hypothetical protein